MQPVVAREPSICNYGLHIEEEHTVTQESIEREILIDAPMDVVWRVVTQPDQITQWFSDKAEIDLRAGGDGVLTFESVNAVAPLQVTTFEPPHLFAFRWSHPDGSQPTESNSTLVEFALSEEGARTRVRLTESGFKNIDWTEDDKVKYIAEHIAGWDQIMPKLQSYAPTAQTVTSR
jgi:uncharacterized protein YndB with AHSA1/START domain